MKQDYTIEKLITDYSKKNNIHNQLNYLLKTRTALRTKLKTTRWKANSSAVIDETVTELELVNRLINYQIKRIELVDIEVLNFGG
jgi:hypothetical protein